MGRGVISLMCPSQRIRSSADCVTEAEIKSQLGDSLIGVKYPRQPDGTGINVNTNKSDFYLLYSQSLNKVSEN